MYSSIDHRHVSRETWTQLNTIVENHRQALDTYLDKLLWWNKKINLVSRNANRNQIWNHIQHSLIPAAMGWISSENTYIDAGTGGGLPGIPLAIAASESRFLLNDINFKKITAVHQMCESLSLTNTKTLRGDYREQVPGHDFILISKHSFKLPPLLRFMRENDQCRKIILYKGQDFTEELPASYPSFEFEAFRLDSTSSAEFYKDKYLISIKRNNAH